MLIFHSYRPTDMPCTQIGTLTTPETVQLCSVSAIPNDAVSEDGDGVGFSFGIGKSHGFAKEFGPKRPWSYIRDERMVG